MADGAWIKMRTALLYDPAVLRMAAQLGTTPVHVAGCCYAVWCIADQHASEDGVCGQLDAESIDMQVQHSGFAQAMQDAGWLSFDGGCAVFPNYAHHNGSTAKTRAENQKRQQKKRERDKRDEANVTQPSRTSVTTALPEKNREEKRREESKTPPCIPPQRDEAVGYARTIGLPDAEVDGWFDHHEARGWVLTNGRKMKDWKAALRTWKRNAERFNGGSNRKPAQINSDGSEFDGLAKVHRTGDPDATRPPAERGGD